MATQRLYIGGHADIDRTALGTATQRRHHRRLDITDPAGRLVTGAGRPVAGAAPSRWQLDERDGILRVISQRGAGRTGNGSIGAPQIRTRSNIAHHAVVRVPPGATGPSSFRVKEARAPCALTNPRAYAMTYNQTDPMFGHRIP